MKYEFDSINHLHKLDGVALTGTSSVGDVLFKPLNWWAAGKAMETMGWIHPEKKVNGERIPIPIAERLVKAEEVRKFICDMTTEEYLELLDKGYHAHNERKKEAAEKGTDLHAELEKYVKAAMKGKILLKYDERIKPFIEWAEKNVEKFIASEAHCFDEELWIGGIVDCVAELKDGSIAIVDFKSAKEAHATAFIQCGGYAIQIARNGLWDKTGKHNKKLDKPIGKLIVVPFGAEVVKPEIRDNVKEYTRGFWNAVALYRLLGLEKSYK